MVSATLGQRPGTEFAESTSVLLKSIWRIGPRHNERRRGIGKRNAGDSLCRRHLGDWRAVYCKQAGGTSNDLGAAATVGPCAVSTPLARLRRKPPSCPGHAKRMHHAAALAIGQALTSQRRRRVVSWPMAQMSEYSIVTYEREPGHWRAAVSPKVLDRSRAPGKTVHSTVTPDDSASESEAKLAATRLIRKLQSE